MAMNHMRKSSAIKRYATFIADGNTVEQLQEALQKDQLELKPDEIEEVISAILEGDANNLNSGGPDFEQKSSTPPPTPPVAPANRAGKLIQYELWKVKPRSEKLHIDGSVKNVLRGFDQHGDGPLRVVNISENHAAALNAQVQNTLEYYFAPGEEPFIPMDKFL
jgi:hypothetical protein